MNDQHVRELQCEGRVGYGRAEAADQVRGSLACSVHRARYGSDSTAIYISWLPLHAFLITCSFPAKTKFVMD